MSKKVAERGNKRSCPSCEARFYDLNRDPMTCPMCQEQFEVVAFGLRTDIDAAAAAAAGKASRKAASKRAAFVPAPETPADDGLPEVADVPDVELEGEEAAAEGEEETFLPEEEEDTDVSGLIEGGIEEGGEEET
jgi:uncharacterized protein (TIGR02300 family)